MGFWPPRQLGASTFQKGQLGDVYKIIDGRKAGPGRGKIKQDAGFVAKTERNPLYAAAT